jgi:hypothetical protein
LLLSLLWLASLLLLVFLLLLASLLLLAFLLLSAFMMLLASRLMPEFHEWFGTKFRAFLSSMKGTVRNRIPSVSLSLNSSERNSEIFVFRGMVQNEIPSVFSSAKQAEFQRKNLEIPSVSCSGE